jgi:RNA polymerase sigma factor (TIGR02999 family)
MPKVTGILSALEHSNPGAPEQLLPQVYDELRTLAAQKLAEEKPGQTLQATALVHEAYLRLVGIESPGSLPSWDDQAHFFAAAAKAMRRMLIEQARRKTRKKRSRAGERLPLDAAATLAAPYAAAADELIALDDCLKQLEAEEPIKARLVKLRYFAGLSIANAARTLGISPATARRYWVYARSWLYGRLHAD